MALDFVYLAIIILYGSLIEGFFQPGDESLWPVGEGQCEEVESREAAGGTQGRCSDTHQVARLSHWHGGCGLEQNYDDLSASALQGRSNDLHLGGTLSLPLLPQRVVPVEVEEEHDEGGDLLGMLGGPAGLQDAHRDVVIVAEAWLGTLWVEVVCRHVLVENGFSLGTPRSRGELVPHRPVHCIIFYVQSRERYEAPRGLRERLGELEAGGRHGSGSVPNGSRPNIAIP